MMGKSRAVMGRKRRRNTCDANGKGPMTRAFSRSGRPDSNRRPSPWQGDSGSSRDLLKHSFSLRDQGFSYLAVANRFPSFPLGLWEICGKGLPMRS
jgi:hypothetical protein